MLKSIVVRPDGSKEFADDIIKWCKENPRRYYPTIRRLARYDGFVARKVRGNGLWYFADDLNILRSPEKGVVGRGSVGVLVTEGGRVMRWNILSLDESNSLVDFPFDFFAAAPVSRSVAAACIPCDRTATGERYSCPLKVFQYIIFIFQQYVNIFPKDLKPILPFPYNLISILIMT
jgi:hypothetical protein